MQNPIDKLDRFLVKNYGNRFANMTLAGVYFIVLMIIGTAAIFTLMALAGSFASEAEAGAPCRVQTRSFHHRGHFHHHNHHQQIQVITPFAVPVGVPVATYSPYWYSTSQYQQQLQQQSTLELPKPPAAKPSGSPADNATGQSGGTLTPKVPEGPSNAAQDVTPADTTGQGMEAPYHDNPAPAVQQNCVKCHSGANPKGDLNLSDLSLLDSATKLSAIKAVVNEKMPPGKKGQPPNTAKLSPEVVGRIIEELSR